MPKGLIIQQQWLSLIFYDSKTWEMRTKPTKIRGTIQLIAAKTGYIVGQVDLIDSPLTKIQADNYFFDLHKIKDTSLLEKWCYPWILQNPIKYDTPIPYKHPAGAVIWVNL